MSEQPWDTASRRALHELIDLLGEVDRRWVSPEWNLHTADDVVGAHRALMHYLQWGLVGLFERDPAAPRFHRIVAPDRKLLGDNPDAVYFDAPISADHAYRVTGETKGATYVSITVESGEAWGSMDNQVVGVLNDTSFDIDADGRFEILVGGEPRQRNWLALPEGRRVDQHPPLLRGRHPRGRRPGPGPNHAHRGGARRWRPRRTRRSPLGPRRQPGSPRRQPRHPRRQPGSPRHPRRHPRHPRRQPGSPRHPRRHPRHPRRHPRHPRRHPRHPRRHPRHPRRHPRHPRRHPRHPRRHPRHPRRHPRHPRQLRRHPAAPPVGRLRGRGHPPGRRPGA